MSKTNQSKAIKMERLQDVDPGEDLSDFDPKMVQTVLKVIEKSPIGKFCKMMMEKYREEEEEEKQAEQQEAMAAQQPQAPQDPNQTQQTPNGAGEMASGQINPQEIQELQQLLNNPSTNPVEGQYPGQGPRIPNAQAPQRNSKVAKKKNKEDGSDNVLPEKTPEQKANKGGGDKEGVKNHKPAGCKVTKGKAMKNSKKHEKMAKYEADSGDTDTGDEDEDELETPVTRCAKPKKRKGEPEQYMHDEPPHDASWEDDDDADEGEWDDEDNRDNSQDWEGDDEEHPDTDEDEDDWEGDDEDEHGDDEHLGDHNEDDEMDHEQPQMPMKKSASFAGPGSSYVPAGVSKKRPSEKGSTRAPMQVEKQQGKPFSAGSPLRQSRSANSNNELLKVLRQMESTIKELKAENKAIKLREQYSRRQNAILDLLHRGYEIAEPEQLFEDTKDFDDNYFERELNTIKKYARQNADISRVQMFNTETDNSVFDESVEYTPQDATYIGDIMRDEKVDFKAAAKKYSARKRGK